jgi:pimeloyl-ACP methyl ester carboxylesterase
MSTWVLLRGLMRESRHWGNFPAQFQNIVGAHQVITLDFPGNGSLFKEDSFGSVSEMANHCRTHLKQMDISPPYNVLALSLGAMVAVEWSEQHPSDFERLILINTSLAPLNPFYHRLRPKNYPALIRSMIFGSIFERERLILHLTSSQQRTSQRQNALLERWAFYARECPVSRTNILRQLRAAVTYRAKSTSPHIPVLLLAGKQDRLVNVKCSLQLAERWGIPIKLHSTAGHDLPLDDEEWVARQVKEWCDQTKKQT